MPSVCKSSSCKEFVCPGSDYCAIHCTCSHVDGDKTHCSVVNCGDTMHASDYRRCALHCDKKSHGHCIISTSDLDHFQNLDPNAFAALGKDIVRTQGKYCTSTSVVGKTNLCIFHIRENIKFISKLKEFYDANPKTTDKQFIWAKLTKKYSDLYNYDTNTVTDFDELIASQKTGSDPSASPSGKSTSRASKTSTSSRGSKTTSRGSAAVATADSDEEESKAGPAEENFVF